MESSREKITELLKVMSLLRDKEHGCSWDLKQTFKSIAPHTLEECYEVIECIEQEDFQYLAEELGDLLFQVVFYAQMATEEKLFNFDDICDAITNKLLTRHPHVFPDATIESFGKENNLTPAQVEANWEKIKQEERQKQNSATSPGLLDDIPQALPAVLRAKKLQSRAATGGFDWESPQSVIKKIFEEIEELEEAMQAKDQMHIEEEFGDLMFSIVNLRSANSKFSQRFKLIESMLREKKLKMNDLTIDELESYWELAKQKLAKQP